MVSEVNNIRARHRVSPDCPTLRICVDLTSPSLPGQLQIFPTVANLTLTPYELAQPWLQTDDTECT